MAETATARTPRGADRRRAHRFKVGERRSGFDRRRRAHRAFLGAAFEDTLIHLRDHPRTLAELLFAANLLSLLDLALTLKLLRLGVATEANPVMQYFFAGGFGQAAAAKFAIVAAASLAIWALRRRRAALTTALFLVGLYGAVVLYEIAGLIRVA